jgi:hypothetical protein
MSAYLPAALRSLVRERFGNRCAYCQTAEHLTATHFEIEHIDPRAAGGQTVFANLCLTCPMCNRFKSDSSSAVDPMTEIGVPLFHPVQQAWSEHFAWSDGGADQWSDFNWKSDDHRTSDESAHVSSRQAFVDCDGRVSTATAWNLRITNAPASVDSGFDPRAVPSQGRICVLA